jgi:allantoin racemase
MEFKRIRVITPVTGEALGNAEFARGLGDAATEVDLVQIERGPASIECEFEHAMAVPDTLRLIVDAEREGVAAVVVDCMADPGVRPGRELVRIPVVGPAEASMHLACQLGHRFSIVTTEARSVPEFENQARVAGLAERLASVRWVDIPVLDLASDPKALLAALIDESVSAIEADGAHVIVFGCTGMLGFAEGVRDGLVARGYSGVPVLDPVPVAVRTAQALLACGLTHSARTWPSAPVKRIDGYGFLADALAGSPTGGEG